MRRLALTLGLTCVATLRATAQSASTEGGPVRLGATSAFSAPAWAFPTALPAAPDPFPTADSTHQHRIPGAGRSFTQKQAFNRHAPIDWFPGSHPAAPRPVMLGRRPDAWACAFCHLPDGAGRPENAVLAGLPAEYIVRQVRAFRDETRRSANPVAPLTSMHRLAKLYTDGEVAEAAAYFARLQLTRRNRIVESDSVPRHHVAGVIYTRDGTGQEPIDGRLIEMPDDFERHELHDPTVRYTTWVPKGSLALGRRIVTQGPAGIATACATCHGPSLLGVGPVPPIAGRSPQYLLRQLISFRTGARADSASTPMLAVVRGMTLQHMVAAAAYVGSLEPR